MNKHEVKYSVTIRSLLKNANKPDELIAETHEMSASELSLWLSQTMAECKAVLQTYPEPNLTEENITEQFNALVGAVNILEQKHDSRSLTFKILKAYITVQVIFPKEEST